jgi:hypothetical protein
VPRPLTSLIIEELLSIWCESQGFYWEASYLLDRVSWDSHRRANHVRGIKLPAAEWVIYLAHPGLQEMVNQIDPEDQRYNDLVAYLRPHGLTLYRLTPYYVRVYRLRRSRGAIPV